MMAKGSGENCRRPYSLGKRVEQSDRNRSAILAAARELLASPNFSAFSLDAVAQGAGVTRQTIYNLFGAKAGLLEALFDQVAGEGGMARMPSVMQERDPEQMLIRFVELFADFWGSNRLLLRRVHGIAAIDPEFDAVLAARQLRRHRAATRVVERLESASDPKRQVRLLHALTSFAFYDALFSTGMPREEIQSTIIELGPKRASRAY